jgi:hypothetical protein
MPSGSDRQAVHGMLNAYPQCEHAPSVGGAGRADASRTQHEERALTYSHARSAPLLRASAPPRPQQRLRRSSGERTQICLWCSAGGRALTTRAGAQYWRQQRCVSVTESANNNAHARESQCVASEIQSE